MRKKKRRGRTIRTKTKSHIERILNETIKRALISAPTDIDLDQVMKKNDEGKKNMHEQLKIHADEETGGGPTLFY